MACRNQERFIREALSSVLADADEDLELIAADDGSTDGTAAVLAEFAAGDARVVLLSTETPTGPARTRNLCARHAHGEFLVIMDADDVNLPGRIQNQVEFLEAHPDVGVVGGSIEMIDENGDFLGTRTYPGGDADIRRVLLKVTPFAHPATAIRRTVFESVGGYDPTLDYAEDLDLWFRLGKITQFANLQRPVLRYRFHRRSTTSRSALRMQLRSVKFRLAAIFRYDYPWTVGDILFNLGAAATFPFPLRLKLKLFEWVRSHVVSSRGGRD